MRLPAEPPTGGLPGAAAAISGLEVSGGGLLPEQRHGGEADEPDQHPGQQIVGGVRSQAVQAVAETAAVLATALVAYLSSTQTWSCGRYTRTTDPLRSMPQP